MPEETVYIGVDITGGKRPVTYAAIDRQLHILELDDVTLDEAYQAVLRHPSAVCAIDAPGSRNKGLMADQGYRARLGIPAGKSRYGAYRVCEYELRRRGIGIYNTPLDESAAKSWMKEGWRLYGLLQEAGYVYAPQAGPRRMFETHPHACYTTLIKQRPYLKTSLEGRLQRQMLLYQEGIDIPDPMNILEEWTRHRFLTGQLPVESLLSDDRLDALIAAYTAFVYAKEPHNTCTVGDPLEGIIVLPVATLEEQY